MRAPWLRRRHSLRAPGPLDLEASVGDEPVVRLDHFCPGAGMHRLLCVELTPAELVRMRAGGVAAISMRCDLCLWERRLRASLAGTRSGRAEPGPAGA